MTNINSNKFLTVFLSFLFIVFIGINLITLFEGHNWGGDFSQYILHSQNILAQRGYSENIVLDVDVVYPLGLPILIAPILYFFGLNFIALKSINILFWYASIFIFYKIAERRVDRTLAILCCVFLAVSSEFFYFKQNVLSDIPFLFFSLSSIFLFIKYADDENGKLLSTVLLMSFSLLIRSAGLILFVAALYYLLIRKKWKSLFIVLAGLFVTLAVQRYIIGSSSGFFVNIINEPLLHLTVAVKQNSHPFRSILWAICPGQTLFSASIFQFLDKCVVLISPLLYLWIIFVFIKKTLQRNISYLGCFFFFYLGMLFVWSAFPNSVTEYVRFIYPILGIVFIFVIENGILFSQKVIGSEQFKLAVHFLLKCILIVIILINILNIVVIRNFNDDVLFQKDTAEMFEWVRNNIGEDEHYMFWKPKPAALMTGRIGMAPWVTLKGHPLEAFAMRIEKYNISYIILFKNANELLNKVCRDNPNKFTLEWDNEWYNIYLIKKDGRQKIED